MSNFTRQKNRAYTKVERLAILAQRHRTEGREIPPALALDLEQAQREYGAAVLAIRRGQHSRQVEFDHLVTEVARVMAPHTGKAK